MCSLPLTLFSFSNQFVVISVTTKSIQNVCPDSNFILHAKMGLGPHFDHHLWSVLDKAGMLRNLKVPALYIPDAKVKLLSVNSLGDVYPEEAVTFHPLGPTMTGV